ncbi:MAG: quercetin 2,3-dioxygenase [Pseudonocardiales bacterium]|nr:quercetin 2,3-dioxygenase [Pseudonocardiales bacterium]
MIEVRRAGDRFRTDQPGITSWHSFSSGAHYDPGNVSFGPVVACDEHLVDPGFGFERHPHARVELVTWVLDGSLRHEDAAGRTRVVVPGQAQYQRAGTGIEHSERNASESAPLHFVQIWLLSDEDVPGYDLAHPPLTLSAGRFTVLRSCRDERVRGAAVHAFLGAGRFTVAGHELGPGDSVRADEALAVSGDGVLLVVIVDS